MTKVNFPFMQRDLELLEYRAWNFPQDDSCIIDCGACNSDWTEARDALSPYIRNTIAGAKGYLLIDWTY